MQAGNPFFSNDQWGILKVLLFVVAPIVTSICTFLWAIARRQEKYDLNKIGEKVNALEARVDKELSALKAEYRILDEKLGEDRLAYMSALFAAEKKIDERFATVLTAIAELKGAVQSQATMKDAFVDAIRIATKARE